MPALDLRLFGTIHVDSVPKVTAELESYAVGDAGIAGESNDPDDAADPGDAATTADAAGADETAPTDARDDPAPVDVLFIELPDLTGRLGTAAGGSFTGRDALRLYLSALLRTPAFLLGQLLVVAVGGPLYVACNRSLLPAEALAASRVGDRHDLPVHAVDRHPVQAMADAGPPWLLANWAILAALAWTDPRALGVAAGSLVAGAAVLYGLFYADRRAFVALGIPVCLAVLAAVLWSARMPATVLAVVALSTVAVLHRNRNRHMVDRAAAIAAAHGYERGCLLTGKAHLGGVRRAAADRDDVRVTRSLAAKWLRRSTDVTVHATADDGPPADSAGAAGPAPSARPGPTPVVGSAAEVAPRRVGAAAVDLLVLVPLSAVGSLVCGVGTGVVLGDVTTASVVAGALLTPPAYHAVTETLWGRGVGKRLFGLVVVEPDGSRVPAAGALVRTLLRPLDLVLLGLPMFLSRRRRRLGDHLAGTLVVGVEG